MYGFEDYTRIKHVMANIELTPTISAGRTIRGK